MKENLKKFSRFIVVEKKSGRPMAFSGQQLCFCTTSHWEDEHFPIKTYSYRRAHQLITISQIFRKKYNLGKTEYELMPIVTP